MADTTKDFGNSLDLVDVKQIRDNTVIGKDGGLRQIVMVGGVNFALKSDTDQNIMTQAYQNFLNGIEFPLQIVIHSRKVNIDKYADGLMTRKQTEPSPIIQNQIDEYVKFIKGFVEKNAIMEKMFFTVVPFYPVSVVPSGMASSGSGLFGLFGKKNKVQQAAADEKTSEAAEKSFKESLEQLSQRVSQVTEGLTGIGLETTVLNDEQLTELFYNFYNPQTVERKGATKTV
jgi:type IV secretory pathway VirB4 component